MAIEDFDHSFKAAVQGASTTKELDRLALNRIRSLAKSKNNDVLVDLLGLVRRQLNLHKKGE